MTRTRRAGRRRAAVVLAGAALVLAPAAAVQAQETAAGGAAGSGLSSYDLSATAPGVAVRVEDGGYCSAPPAAGCEGVVPEALSRLQNGPVAYGLSSVAWPGTLAGNLGSLLIVAGGSQVPPQATQLNDPIRAEARTGEQASNTTVPGVTMTVKAGADEVDALAQTPQTQAPGVGTFGSVSGTSRTAVTGAASAVASSLSQVTNVALAGGQLKIANLVSTAEATTDGTTTTVKGSTTASGVTIGGVPVTLDDHGITVAGQNQAATAAANAAVNQVVSALGMTVALTSPTGTPKGGAVDYSAGSLTVSWEPQAGKKLTVVLGGATATVNAAPGFDVGATDLTAVTGTTDGTAGSVSSTSGDLGSVPAGTSQLSSAADLSGAPVTTPAIAAPAPRTAAPGPIVATRRAAFPLPTGNGAALVLLALGGVGLAALGLHRLPGLVLAPPSATCPLQEEP